MPKCSKCGADVLPSDAQCMGCGTTLTRADSKPAPSTRPTPPALSAPAPQSADPPRHPGARAGRGPVMPWKTIAWVAVGLAVVVAGALYVTRKAPASALDGVWETTNQESVLYVDTKARTMTYEGPAPVVVRSEVYSSSDGSHQVVEGTRTKDTRLELTGLTITQRPGASFLIASQDAAAELRATLKGSNGLRISTTSKGTLRGLARNYRRQ